MSKPKAAADKPPFDDFDAILGTAFQPEDWYWQVRDDLGFVWSSARQARVPIDDLEFKTWLADGRGMVTKIQSFEDMRDVWAAYGKFLDPAAQYRIIRADRYVKELSKAAEGEQPSFEKTIGDVVDTLIAQVALLIPQASQGTPEFAALFAKIQQIKAEVPKPAIAAPAEEVREQ